MQRPAGVRRASGVALAGVGLLLVSLTFDASPLFVPAVAFIVIGCGAIGWVLFLARDARIERRLHSDRVVEHEPLEATIEVHGGPLGLSGCEVRDPLSKTPLVLRGGGRRATVRVLAHFDRRGIRTLPPPILALHDPLGLAERFAGQKQSEQHVLVLPRTEPIRWVAGDGGDAAEADIARQRAELAIAVVVDGLRPYQPGTPASRIYWHGLARGAGLLERHLRPESDSRPMVVLDTRGKGIDDEVDAAVRAAASLTVELSRARGCWLLLPGERRPSSIEPDLALWPREHARLALVEGGPRAPAPVLGSARGRTGPVFYVTAASLERPPAALGRGPVVLVRPKRLAEQGTGRRLFEVSGCVGSLPSRAGATPPAAGTSRAQGAAA
jgi:uncharacterized protein (DUF58 family)